MPTLRCQGWQHVADMSPTCRRHYQLSVLVPVSSATGARVLTHPSIPLGPSPPVACTTILISTQTFQAISFPFFTVHFLVPSSALLEKRLSIYSCRLGGCSSLGSSVISYTRFIVTGPHHPNESLLLQEHQALPILDNCVI